MIFSRLRNKHARCRLSWIALYRTAFVGMIAGAMLCAGCAPMAELKKKITGSESAPISSSRKTAQPNAAHNSTAKSSPAQSALNEGIALYDEGDFNGAIEHLSNASEIWSANKTVQVSALKYMAFSYCVTSRPTLCKQQFQKALKLDPAFDLAPGEKGHPQWGPVFAQAKKAN
jgi:tetratricopeptide (TPR) repeat protein